MEYSKKEIKEKKDSVKKIVSVLLGIGITIGITGGVIYDVKLIESVLDIHKINNQIRECVLESNIKQEAKFR